MPMKAAIANIIIAEGPVGCIGGTALVITLRNSIELPIVVANSFSTEI